MLIRRLLICVAAVLVGFAGLVLPAKADTPSDPYSSPGVHLVNDRYWKTECSHYSRTVVRCRTEIFATKVFLESGRWYKQNDWVFNNLTYLPSPRGDWAGNNLAATMEWTAADGRQWRSECDTANTGRGACRHYVMSKTASESGGWVTQQDQWVFNSLVKFTTSTVPWVQDIPDAVPSRTDVPVASARVALKVKVTAPAVPQPTPSTKPTQSSYAPSGGNCPAHAPIKGNHSSSGEWIYHVPDGQFYNRTNPEECFPTEAAARAAGYRKSLR